MSGARLTKENMAGTNFIFFPDSAYEAERLQKKLLGLGFVWGTGSKEVGNVEACLKDGLVILDQKIYTKSAGDTRVYTPCSLAKLDETYLSPEMQLMTEMFNQLSARLDGLTEKVDKIYNELYPSVEETKPGLKKPQP